MKKSKKQKRKSLKEQLLEGTTKEEKIKIPESSYVLLKNALLKGTSKDIRKIVGDIEDVYKIAGRLKNFPKQREEIANSIDIYLNSTFGKSFYPAFAIAFLSMINPEINEMIRELIRDILKNELHLRSENFMGIVITTGVMIFIVSAMCFGLSGLRNKSLDLKRDLLLLKSLLKDQ